MLHVVVRIRQVIDPEAPPSTFMIDPEAKQVVPAAGVPLRELMAAQNKPVTTWKAHDLGMQPSQMRRIRMLKLYIPRKEARCQIVEGETDDEAAVDLALKLRECKIIQASSVK